MTKKEDNKTLDKKTKEQKSEKKNTENIDLQQQIIKLETELQEQQEITKKAQHDYINLKRDFERMQKIMEEKEKNMTRDSLIDITKKFLPFVENLRKSLDVLSPEQKEDGLAKGVQLVYDNFLKTLENLGIKPIEAIGLAPDSELHEPVSTQPTEDKKLKGKIIQEFERGFIYIKDDQKIVITTSKVIVGQ